jgi:spore coat protein U-like protein
MKRTINFLAAAVLVFGATAAFGQTADSPTNADNISATVITNCTIGLFDLAFGSYDPTATTDLDQSTTIDVRCTKGTPNVYVTMDNGVNGTRVMTDGTDDLAYQIYSDAAYSSAWPTAANTVTVSFASAVVQTLDVYGRVTAGQAVAAGDYFDTVVATVNW